MDFSEYMTIKEACKILHKSDKQVRRYIKDKRLQAELIGKQYFILRASVARLAIHPVQLEDTLSRQLRQFKDAMTSQLDKMTREYDQKLAELARQLHKANERINELENIVKNAPDPRIVDKVTRHSGEIATNKPAAAIMAVKDFAEIHNVKQRSMNDYVNGKRETWGRLETTIIGNRGGKPVHGFTQAQQAYAIVYFEEHHIAYTKCKDCPHE